MAKKSIILDNGDGRVAFSNTASLSVDDLTNNITASVISASSISLSGISVGTISILTGSGTTFGVFPDGTINSGAIAYDGTKWVVSSLTPTDYIGTASGDLSGTFDSDIKVIGVGNVSSGTLPINFGGTGLNNLVAGQNYVLKISSSAGATPVISALQGTSGSCLLTSNKRWVSGIPNYPDVRFYVSQSSGNQFTWTKPSGARYARVILQAAGGGGGHGASTTNPGAGGGSGGFVDTTIDLKNVSSLAIQAGTGGAGGQNVGSAGASGTSTFVSSPSILIHAYGGSGGGEGAASTTNGGAGGTFELNSGNATTRSGGAGAASLTTAASTTYGMPSGGGRGGSGVPGTVVPMLNKNFGYTFTTDLIDLSTNLIPASGSIGGTTGVAPNKPGYGAGGGGGAINSRGGSGGDGYALIIAW